MPFIVDQTHAFHRPIRRISFIVAAALFLVRGSLMQRSKRSSSLVLPPELTVEIFAFLPHDLLVSLGKTGSLDGLAGCAGRAMRIKERHAVGLFRHKLMVSKRTGPTLSDHCCALAFIWSRQGAVQDIYLAERYRSSARRPEPYTWHGILSRLEDDPLPSVPWTWHDCSDGRVRACGDIIDTIFIRGDAITRVQLSTATGVELWRSYHMSRHSIVIHLPFYIPVLALQYGDIFINVSANAHTEVTIQCRYGHLRWIDRLEMLRSDYRLCTAFGRHVSISNGNARYAQ